MSAAASAAKARGYTVVRRLQAQRALAHKRTVADWAQEGLPISVRALNERAREEPFLDVRWVIAIS